MAYLGSQLTSFDPTRSIPAPRDADRFSGNGSTTSFTLSRSVNAAVDIEVFVENVQQEPLTAYDVNGTSLNFTGAPPSGTNNVYVVYRNFQSGAQVTMPDGSVTYSKLANNLRIFTTDNLTPNGNNSVFTLSEPPADANTVMVTVDGIIQRAPVHYTTSGSTITFTSAPAAGSNVHVRHLGFRTSTTVTQLAANSFISQPNIASPTISGVVTGNTNFDSGTLYVDSINDRVGMGTTNPEAQLHQYLPSGTTYRKIQNGSVNITEYASTAVSAGTYGTTTNHPLYLTTNNTIQVGITTSGLLSFNSGYGSVAPAYGCRAWVNFNGTSTVAIRASGNVSSITDNGLGDYTVNFTTAMPDANYSAVGMVWRDSGPEYYDFGIHGKGSTSPGTGGFTVVTGYSVPYNFDPGFVCLSVFR